MLFGTQLPRDPMYRPRRDGIGSIETTGAGNVALRIGREILGYDGAPVAEGRRDGWEQVAYIVLTPLEARALASEILHNYGREEVPA